MEMGLVRTDAATHISVQLPPEWAQKISTCSLSPCTATFDASAQVLGHKMATLPSLFDQQQLFFALAVEPKTGKFRPDFDPSQCVTVRSSHSLPSLLLAHNTSLPSWQIHECYISQNAELVFSIRFSKFLRPSRCLQEPESVSFLDLRQLLMAPTRPHLAQARHRPESVLTHCGCRQ